MATSRKITAAITLLESAGYTVTPPIDSEAIRKARKPVGRPRKHDARIQALRGPDEDAPLHTITEIAEIVGCSLSTVHAAINRHV